MASKKISETCKNTRIEKKGADSPGQRNQVVAQANPGQRN